MQKNRSGARAGGAPTSAASAKNRSRPGLLARRRTCSCRLSRRYAAQRRRPRAGSPPAASAAIASTCGQARGRGPLRAPRRAPASSAPGAAGPGRVDERQAGQRAATPRRDRSSRRRPAPASMAERRVADEQRGVGVAQHRRRGRGACRHERRGDAASACAHSTRVSATDVRELVSSASRRTCADRHAREERDRQRSGPSRADGDAGHEAVVAAQVLDRRDQPEVDVAGVQQGRARRRHVEAHVEERRAAARGRATSGRAFR